MFLIKFLVTGHELFLNTNELSDSDGGGGGLNPQLHIS